MGCGASSGNQIQKPEKLSPSSTFSSQTGPRYVRKQLIGKGTYGSVYRCVQLQSNAEYAMKVIKVNSKTVQDAKKQIQLLKNQIATLKKLSHPNIVKYYSFDVTPDLEEVQIVLELVKNGTLKQYIDKNGPLTEGVTINLCKKSLQALVYIHDMKIIHRDLKCANVLLTEGLEPKLTDFGTAKIIVEKDHDDIAKLSASLKGTPYYMAPEVLKRTGHNQSADIWSFGCMVIEMLSGKAPWTSINAKFSQIINYISSGVHPPFPPHITKQCNYFLESCLDPIPAKRLKANQLLKHRFIDRSNPHMRKNSFEKPIHNIQKQTKTRNSIVNDISGINLEIQELQQIGEITTMMKKRSSLADIQLQSQSNRNESIKIREQSVKKQNLKHKNKREDMYKAPKKHTQIYNRQIQRLQKLQDEISQVSISQEEMPRDYYVVKKALVNLKKNKRTKGNSKTSATLKNTQQNLLSISNSQMIANSDEFQSYLRSNTEMTHEQEFINTAISKAERDQYIQDRKILQLQRQNQKLKWEQQLKEGAEMLKKQLSSRYVHIRK